MTRLSSHSIRAHPLASHLPRDCRLDANADHPHSPCPTRSRATAAAPCLHRENLQAEPQGYAPNAKRFARRGGAQDRSRLRACRDGESAQGPS